MRAVVIVLLLLLAPSCKSKHRAVERERMAVEQTEREAVEARQLYGRELQAVSRLSQSDSVRILITDYRPDGSVERTTEIQRGRQILKTDSTSLVDSLTSQETRAIERETQAQIQRTVKTSTEAKPSLGIPWWLWVGLIIALAIVAWLYMRFGRR